MASTPGINPGIQAIEGDGRRVAEISDALISSWVPGVDEGVFNKPGRYEGLTFPEAVLVEYLESQPGSMTIPLRKNDGSPILPLMDLAEIVQYAETYAGVSGLGIAALIGSVAADTERSTL